MPTIRRTPAAAVARATQPAADASSAAEITAALDGIAPRPLEASAYEARFDRHRSATFATVGDQGVAVAYDPRNPRGPAYLAEAGKPLRVVTAPDKFLHADAVKIDLCYRYEGEKEPRRLPIADGTRDRHTGALVCLPATIDIPDDARGKLHLSFEITSKDGRVSSQWNPHYDATIVPKGGATLVFDEGWGERALGTVQAGERLQLAYDSDRLRSILADSGGARMTACVSFNGDPPLELPLDVSASPDGAPTDGLTYLPAVRVPYDAHSVRLWFRAEDDGKTAWDSNLGQDYTFPVALPEPDADPSWKKFIVNNPGFPKLRDGRFVTLAPGDEGYNCIAWSLGLRDEWVWPGERVGDFDALYAAKGYQPLDELDVTHDPALEKVALYGHQSSYGAREIAVTHAARMDAEGRWTSKLGTEPLIRHDDVHDVEGPSYGKLVRVYARPRPGAPS